MDDRVSSSTNSYDQTAGNSPDKTAGKDCLPNASLETMRARHDLLKLIRAFFDQRGFLEVTTPLLSQDTVVDEHLDPFRVVCYEDPTAWETGELRYLQTSPEFHMKRMLCAGATEIYQITHAFRAAELGPLHNPEFTMAEWYRVGDDMQAGIQLLKTLMEEVTGSSVSQVSYLEAFQRSTGLDPHMADLESLRSVAQSVSASGTQSTVDQATSRQSTSNQTISELTSDDCLHLIWSLQVTPELGTESPIVVCDFPASQAALAELRNGDPPVAERFELYWRGVELANGYHELRSANDLRQRSKLTSEKRRNSNKMPLSGDSRLLKAMQIGLPKCSGVALGVDRLLMLLLGQKTLAGVLSFNFLRA